jgi:hypothetical protein
MFLSGDEQARPILAQLIRDAGFDPGDLGGIDDSRLQDPDSALWINILTHDEATALVPQADLDVVPSASPANSLHVARRTGRPEVGGVSGESCRVAKPIAKLESVSQVALDTTHRRPRGES